MRAARAIAAFALCSAALAAPAAAAPTPAELKRDLQGLVRAPAGPPGAIATLYRDGKLTAIRAGKVRVGAKRAPAADDHMRIASITKAFTGAIALNLARAGKLSLSDTIGQRRPDLPAAWGLVTVRQMLNHTSGLPDYTRSEAFFEQAQTDPAGYVAPLTIIDWVRSDPLEFDPGSKYEYSNTDNIVVGLIAETVTGRSYASELRRVVFGPAKLRQTSFPSGTPLPQPYLHGYVTEAGEPPEDVSEFLSPSGAWASGAIASTPRDLNAFIRADLGLEYFGPAQQRQQMRWVPGGESSPPGPGRNSAGLALFRYETRCGTVFGHTGNFPGYVQFAAATKNGKRAVTTSLNIPAPSGALLARLRAFQAKAVCALLRG